MAGGRGGGFNGIGGAGGQGHDGQAGSSGSSSSENGGIAYGGGGGGAAGGGQGGSGYYAAGGAGGTASNPDGGAGEDSIYGGGGGGGGFNGATTSSDYVTGTIRGGAGGRGGAGTVYSSGGGGGGAGGFGVVSTGQNLVNYGSISGGAGGAGGSSPSYAGAGGDGGVGVDVTGNGATFFNYSGSVTGGQGGGDTGHGGAGVVFENGGVLINNLTIQGGYSTNADQLGAGVVGAGLTINNFGTIEGGSNDNGQGDAIDFTGSQNSLSLEHGTLIGAVALTGQASLEFSTSGTLANALEVSGTSVIGAADGVTATLTGNVGTLDSQVVFGTATDDGTIVFGSGANLIGGATFAAGTDTFASGSNISATSLDVAGAAVTFGANEFFGGSFILHSGSVNTGVAFLNLYGQNTLSGGTITGQGHVALYGKSTTFLGGKTTVAGQETLIDGSNLIATATLALGKGGDLSISKNGTYDLANNVSITAATASNTVTNAGLLEKTAGKGTGVVSAAIANNGQVVVSRGTLDLTQAVSGTGTLGISGNSAMELGALISSQQTMHFGSGNGHLYLDDPTQFHASTNGFNAGDTISLKGFDDHASILYEATQGGGGMLSVTEGSQTFSTHLAANYNANGFSLTSSSHGETIHYSAPRA